MILLGTHVLVWLRTAPDQLSRAAASAIRKELASDCVAIAAIALWELSWLGTFGRIDPGGAVSSFLSKVTAGVVILPMSPEIAAQAAAFPAATFPKDQADRMIGATALLSGIALVTRDGAIRASRLVRTIWCAEQIGESYASVRHHFYECRSLKLYGADWLFNLGALGRLIRDAMRRQSWWRDFVTRNSLFEPLRIRVVLPRHLPNWVLPRG